MDLVCLVRDSRCNGLLHVEMKSAEAFHIHVHTVLSVVTVTKNSCGITYEGKLLSELPCLL